MSQQDENKIVLSKKGRREVSPFISHELLYDYSMGSLDSERKDAVADHIKFSREAQLDLEKIQNGHKYASQLSQTVVSQTVIEKMNAPSTYLSVLMQKTQFEKWPIGLKWGLEAMLVVMAMVLVLTLTPWQKVFEWSQGLSSKDVILAEASKSQTTSTVEDHPDFVDEGINAGAATAADKNHKTSTPTVSSTELTKVTQPAQQSSPAIVAKTPAPVPTPVAKEVPSQPTATPVAAAAVTATNTATASSGGFLYRGQFTVTNLDVTGAKITEKIASLGGRKAGAVELGWKKTPTSIYYHFTIPESKYQELITFLQTYGAVKMSKEKHPRVMPDGIVRVIFTVDEGQQ